MSSLLFSRLYPLTPTPACIKNASFFSKSRVTFIMGLIFTSLGCIPMYFTRILCAFSGIFFKVKRPSTSVMVLISVPNTLTNAPTTGCPSFLNTIVPETSGIWAIIIPEIIEMNNNANNFFIFIFNLCKCN